VGKGTAARKKKKKNSNLRSPPPEDDIYTAIQGRKLKKRGANVPGRPLARKNISFSGGGSKGNKLKKDPSPEGDHSGGRRKKGQDSGLRTSKKKERGRRHSGCPGSGSGVIVFMRLRGKV